MDATMVTSTAPVAWDIETLYPPAHAVDHAQESDHHQDRVPRVGRRPSADASGPLVPQRFPQAEVLEQPPAEQAETEQHLQPQYVVNVVLDQHEGRAGDEQRAAEVYADGSSPDHADSLASHILRIQALELRFLRFHDIPLVGSF